MSGLLYDTGKESDIHFYKHTDKGMVRCESRHFPFFSSFYMLLIGRFACLESFGILLVIVFNWLNNYKPEAVP